MTMPRQAQRRVGLPGMALVVAGAVLVLIAFRFLDWYDAPASADSAPQISFDELHSSADQLGGTAAATAYFDWLAWVLLIALVAAGVAGNVPSRATDAMRVTGFVLGAVGVAATFVAIAQLHHAQVSAGAARHSVFYNSTWGFWLTVAGFALAAVGAALGPRKVRA
jgi:hypothetical protein